MSPRVLGLASAGVGPRPRMQLTWRFILAEYPDLYMCSGCGRYRAGRCGDHFVDDPILVTLEITLVATKAESHNMGGASIPVGRDP